MKKIEKEYRAINKITQIQPGDAILDMTASTRFWRTSNLQHIELILYENNSFRELRWESEKESDEYDLLTELSSALSNSTRIITFNGHSFDLPHLKSKYKAYRIDDPLTGKEDFDLLLKLKELAAFFGLPSRSLDDFSDFLDLSKYNENDFNDAERTLELFSLLAYLGFLNGEKLEIISVSLLDGLLVYDLKNADPFPREISVHDTCFHILFCENGNVRLSSRIEDGTVRFYHTDVKDYEYLPQEGYAIHRSASGFVDKSRKEKATRETCFHRFHLSDAFLNNHKQQETYLRSILDFLRTR